MRRALVHWEAGAVLEVIALGLWVSAPGPGWAVVAAAGAVAVMAAAVMARRPTAIVVSVIALAGAGAALLATFRIRGVETRWPEVREELIGEASVRLDAMLVDAVQNVGDLAAVAAAAGPERAHAFETLEQAVARPGPERGVVVLDSAGPWVWAGRQRVPAGEAPAELFARMTPYYAVLLARRQADNGRVALAHLVLQADSAVPDRAGTVAERFSRETGAQLAFFAPGAAPPGADVFDYCQPSCRAPDADTLFSILTVPPAQGAMKLALVASGGRAVSWIILGMLAALVLLAPRLRAAAVLGGIAIAILTPLPTRLGVGGPFSAGTYFVGGLGAFAASAGALFLTGVLVIVLVAAINRDRERTHLLILLPAAAGIAVAPELLEYLAEGITPPLSDVTLDLWLVWQLSLTVTGAALILGLGALVRWGAPGRSPVWMSWLAAGWATVAAIVGVFAWQPQGWPITILWLWIPALIFATQPAPRLRSIAAAAVVAGTAAAMLTWGAVRHGQLRQAEREAASLGNATIDPVTYGMLEQFGAQLALQEPPRTAGALYSRWARTALSRERYPAVLVFMSPARDVVARLDLADIDLPEVLLQSFAQTAINGGHPRIERVARLPGQHYVLSTPYPDGSVVSVVLGPRSHLLEPTRLARFLSGDEGSVPYRLSQTPTSTNMPPARVTWRRDRWVVRGEGRLELFGLRHLHIDLPLDGPGRLFTRGALLLLLDILVVGILAVAAEGLAGRPQFAGWRGILRRPSYRTRLTLALSVFFIVPTVGFAVWTAASLRADTRRTSDLLIQQTLRDAELRAIEVAPLAGRPAQEDLNSLAKTLDAELVMYEGGVMAEATLPVIAELGLLDQYLTPAVYRRIVLDDLVETTADLLIAGRPTRVGYRDLGTFESRVAILAAPRIGELPWERAGQSDFAYGLLLGTLMGLAAAAGLANVAARSLARPVQALRIAAERVGRGDPLLPLDPEIPAEFVPVAVAFERMAQDVTAGRAALEGARQRMASVLRHVATGVIALDPDMRTTLANPRAEELLGVRLRPGVVVQSATSDVWAPIWKWVAEFIRSGAETGSQEFTVLERRIRGQVAMLGGDRGGCVVALDDATEMARATRVLAWGELARQIAHEIKNPLTPIRLGIQHLRRAHRDKVPDFDPVLERTSEQILAEIERLNAIARAFARFGAPPADAGPLEAVDLARVAAETAQLYALGGSTSVVVLGDAGTRAVARGDEFKEVLVNLIENARDAGAAAVRINIETDGDGRAHVTVADDGKGIPATDLPRIFEPQFSTTTSGTGLGLAICRRLVESWGGTIDVGSVVGQGTVVTIHVGRATEPTRPPPTV